MKKKAPLLVVVGSCVIAAVGVYTHQIDPAHGLGMVLGAMTIAGANHVAKKRKAKKPSA